jgi:hypothetical protein
MEAEMALGFAAVAACLLVIAILVFASRGVIEKVHRESFRSQAEADPSGEEAGNHGDTR